MVEQRIIERVDVHLLRVPLKRPYRLAFGDLMAFDTLLVELTDGAGNSGFGEATLLAGYGGDTPDGAWTQAAALADLLRSGVPLADFRAKASDGNAASHAVATAFLTALDMLEGHPLLQRSSAVAVPLLAILNAIEPAAIADEFDSLLAQGYRTIKLKVGLAGVDDQARLRDVQKVVAGRARIRIDANQAFDAEQAAAFLSAMDPQDVELFEQPCGADDWAAHAFASRFARVPLMLDESIFTLEDIDRAADEGLAAYVKLKLVKFGSLDLLAQGLARIRERGLRPVLGNGVACDIGCWMEACVAAHHIDNAGEMNGYLKPRMHLLANPPRLVDGSILLEPQYRPVLDRDVVKATCVESISVWRHSRASFSPPHER